MYESPPTNQDIVVNNPYRPFKIMTLVSHVLRVILATWVGFVAFFIMHQTGLDFGSLPLDFGSLSLFVLHALLAGSVLAFIEFTMIYSVRVPLRVWIIYSIISWLVGLLCVFVFINSMRRQDVDLIHIIASGFIVGVCLAVGQGLCFPKDRRTIITWFAINIVSCPVGFLGALFTLFR